jgi:hypothetical protein
MSERPPEDVYRELEDDVANYRISSGRAQVLREVSEGYEPKGDQIAAENTRIEAAAFELHTRQTNKAFSGYFQPMIVFSEGHTAPPQDFFDEEKLNYLTVQARTVSNPIHAARFADVAWDLATRRNPEMARLAVRKYLDCANLYRANRWGTDFGDAIKRAAELANMIRDSGLLSTVKENVLSRMRDLDHARDYRFCSDLATALKKAPRMELTDAEWREVVDVLDHAAAYFQEEPPEREESLGPVDGPRERLVRSFLESKLSLAARTGLIDADAARTALARSFEREADQRLSEENPLAVVSFYLEAEQAYERLGMREDRDRVRVKLRDAGVRSEEHMQPISTTVPIETAEIEEYIRPLLGEDGQDTLQRIAASSLFIPDLDEARQSAERNHETYIAQRLFPRITFNREYTVGYHGSDEELAEAAVTDYLVIGIRVAGVFRAYLLDKLKTDYSLTADSLLHHFRTWGVCKPRNLTLLERGFEHYFKEDYISALHILIPQFEDTLRSLLEAANRPVARPLKGTATLGALLDDSAFHGADDENLHRYYELVLLEDGLNLRNSVAHGLLEPEAMDLLTVELIIDLLLTLTSFSPQDIAAQGTSS